MTGLFFSLKVTSTCMIFGKNSGVPAGLPCVRQSQDIVHYIKNIAVILFAVAISAYAPILLLLFPQRQQLFPDAADQRQGAQAGFRLGTVGADDFTFAVYLCVGYLVTMCLMVMVSRSKSMASHFSPSASLRRRP